MNNQLIMANQKLIAEALNLSVMTVSRALRNHPDLTEATKQRVRQKAEELGYRKHLEKASLAQGKQAQRATIQRIGILLFKQDNNNEDPLNFETTRKIFASIQEECQSLGIETPVETLPQDSPKRSTLIKNRSIEGLLLMGRYPSGITDALGGIPALAVSNFIECVGIPHVVADNFHGMRKTTEHLISLGHRKILFIGSDQPNTQLFQERAYGYQAAMQAHDLKPNIIFLNSCRNNLPLQEISRYTAIACSNDNLAYQVQAGLMDAGLKLPEDCSMASFDNIHVDEHAMPITSYEPDWELLGSTAVNLLTSPPPNFLNNDIAVTIPGKLILRDSARPPASAQKS
ncbi:LacI family DNA-binding transcriptional regulator [Ruficoccus amylovorans]|uniref:LacI family DNA-binding transcriptional regulator n=1 Tax=Ruficoccus amylovorans TaxID=1804625 RepID=A0A842HCP2_9BACT|nr:LacI family DNA-binding transcriptional regulator [Ruficoccus amylovorans]MBC2593838.1 LacI family DNA-binding transcriptional regulator [Ruficoccus amylovorans]